MLEYAVYRLKKNEFCNLLKLTNEKQRKLADKKGECKTMKRSALEEMDVQTG
jgi:hypothetical protein